MSSFVWYTDFTMRKGLLVAPKLIFVPASVRDCSNAEGGRGASFGSKADKTW